MYSKQTPRSKHKRTSVLPFFLLLCAALVALAGCARPGRQVLHLQGRIEAVTTILPAPADGKVQGLIVEKGDRIRKGEPLFGVADGTGTNVPGKAARELAQAQAELRRLQAGGPAVDRASAAAAVQGALADVQRASATYQKMTNLYAIGGVSKRQVDQSAQTLASARDRLAAAQAELRQAQTAKPSDSAALQAKVKALKDAYEREAEQTANEVKAPFTGLVGGLQAANGASVRQGQPVLTLTATTECYIRIPQSVRDGRLEPGRTVTLTAPGLQKPFIGIIRENTDRELVLFSDQKPEDLPAGASVGAEISL